MKLTIIGTDIAQHVFQLHALDPLSGQIERFKLKRASARVLRETCTLDCRDGSLRKRPRLGETIASPWA
jgi:hypothetical protein